MGTRYTDTAAIKRGALWGQLRVHLGAGFGLRGWSEARQHPQTGQDDGDAGRAGSEREEEERRQK